MKKDIMLTSGYHFEGYCITDYYGFFSGEAVIGTGFFSEMRSGISDMFGTKSKAFSDKLEDVKEYAIEELINNVFQKTQANAIIGLDVDYNTFEGNIIAVIANGTAVKIEKEEMKEEYSKILDCPVMDYNFSIDIRPCKARFYISDSKPTLMQLQVYSYSPKFLSAMQFDLSVNTLLGDQYKVTDMILADFKIDQEQSTKTIGVYQSERMPIELPISNFRAIESVNINVKKYKQGQEIGKPAYANTVVSFPVTALIQLKKRYGDDAVSEIFETDDTWTCACGYQNSLVLDHCSLCHRQKGETICGDPQETIEKYSLYHTILDEVQPLGSAKEILEGLKRHQGEIPDEIIEKIEKMATNEAMFGNMKRDCIQYLEQQLPH